MSEAGRSTAQPHQREQGTVLSIRSAWPCRSLDMSVVAPCNAVFEGSVLLWAIFSVAPVSYKDPYAFGVGLSTSLRAVRGKRRSLAVVELTITA